MWLTYRQAISLGAQVRKGERAVMCAKFERKQRRPDEPVRFDEEPEDLGERPGFLRCKPFWVFNAAQIDGLPRSMTADTLAAGVGLDRSPIEGAMRFIGGCRADIRHGYAKAAYAPRADRILMPDIDRFTSPEAYCATALHELVHWTGHPGRLGRTFSQRFGDAAYAFEQLVAELGSAFALGHIGLIKQTVEGHAAYLEAWLKVLRSDRTAIFSAARLAGEAFEYILARQMPGEVGTAHEVVE